MELSIRDLYLFLSVLDSPGKTVAFHMNQLSVNSYGYQKSSGRLEHLGMISVEINPENRRQRILVPQKTLEEVFGEPYKKIVSAIENSRYDGLRDTEARIVAYLEENQVANILELSMWVGVEKRTIEKAGRDLIEKGKIFLTKGEETTYTIK